MTDDIRTVSSETRNDRGQRVSTREVIRLHNSDQDHDQALSKAQQLVYVLTGILVGLLSLRVLLSLLGANPGNSFADAVYSLSYPFVAPFFGLFGYTFHRGTARLELETLFAIVVYMLIGWAIISLLATGKRGSYYHST